MAARALTMIPVRDIDSQTAFYRDVLGMVVTCSRPGWVEFGRSGVILTSSGGDARLLLDVENADQTALLDPEGNVVALRRRTVTHATVLNDVLHEYPEAMAALEAHGIRLCGGCTVLLNSSMEDVAAFSGLSPAESAQLVAELSNIVERSNG